MAVPKCSRELFFPSVCSLTSYARGTLELSANSPHAPIKPFSKKVFVHLFQKVARRCGGRAALHNNRARSALRFYIGFPHPPLRGPPSPKGRLTDTEIIQGRGAAQGQNCVLQGCYAQKKRKTQIYTATVGAVIGRP